MKNKMNCNEMKCLIKMNVQVKHEVFWKLRVPSPPLGVNEDLAANFWKVKVGDCG